MLTELLPFVILLSSCCLLVDSKKKQFASNPTPLTTVGYNLIWYESTADSQGYTAVSSSSSGQYLNAVANNFGIYYSNNYGSSWRLSNATAISAIAIASSCSGKIHQTLLLYVNLTS